MNPNLNKLAKYIEVYRLNDTVLKRVGITSHTLEINGKQVTIELRNIDKLTEQISIMMSDVISEVESGLIAKKDLPTFYRLYWYWYGEEYKEEE